MQVQTTTITTERMNVEGGNFQVTVFEQTTTAFCDCCSNQAKDTIQELKRRGWGFGNGSEFCPDCNY